MKTSIFLISLIFVNTVFAADAGTCKSNISDLCVPFTSEQKLSASMCHVEMKLAKCDEYFASNPELSNDKRRNCDATAACPSSTATKLTDYTKACLDNWAGAWGDMLVGIYDIVAGDLKLSKNTKEREEFFEKCTSIDCKNKMLGDYAQLFSKEEIEGHSNTQNLDTKDPVNQAYLSGHSAKVLYKKLLERISQKMRNGTLQQPVIEPWSGKPAKPLKSVQELIDNALAKLGIKNTACYNPVALAEMRCYALFTVLDPLLFVTATQKLAVLAGKSVEKTLAKEVLSADAHIPNQAKIVDFDLKLNAKKAHENPKIDAGITNGVEPYRLSYLQVPDSDPSRKFLTEVGVKFSDDGLLTLNSAEVAQKIDTKIDELVTSGKVKESDTLRPVLIYQKEGKTIAVSPNEMPPAGAIRTASLLDGDDFFQLVADGKFPLGDDLLVRTGDSRYNEATFLHDSNHFAGFTNNPEFMASIRQAAKKIINTKDPEFKAILEQRFSFAAEYSQVFPKEKLAMAKEVMADVKEMLGLQKNTFYSPEAYKQALMKLSPEERLKVQSKFINSELDDVRASPLGGAEHLSIHRVAKDYMAPSTLGAFWPLDEAYVNGMHKMPLGVERTPDVITDAFSKSMSKTEAFMNVRAQDWMREGTTGKKLSPLGNTGRLCNALKDSGDAETSKFYMMFCLGK